MKDFVVEEILRAHLSNNEQKARRGYAKPVIPPANRYPHSIARAEIELSRQPWNAGMLGSGNRTIYHRSIV